MIYLDMDGVLADHDKYINKLAKVKSWKDITTEQYEEIYNVPNIFANFEKTKHADKLIEVVVSLFGEYHILSKLPKFRGIETALSKTKWIQEHLKIQPATITYPKGDKSVYAEGNILIDDYAKNIKKWVKAGGIAIKYKAGSKKYTIYDKLQELSTIHEQLK